MDSMKSPSSDSPINRRDFIKMGSATTLMTSLGLGAHGVPGEKPAKRPNIVFVFSDEHRWCSMPFTEMPEVVAPNMSKLAKQGLRFDNCCATSPVCTPYRGILLTGQWPLQSSCISNDTFIDGDVIGQTSPTIAQVFNKGGYKTGYVGKWHLKNETCQHAGFDTFKHWLYGDEHWETEVRDIPSGESFKTVHGYNAIGMTDQAIDFLNENSGAEDPFLLMLSLNPPHWRWDDSPQEFYDLYPDENLPFRPNVFNEKDKQGKQHEYYRHYHGHISAVDRELGRVMQALDDAGISEETILIYTSDHGSSFGSNGVHNKANPFDESVRVPFIVRWPGKIAAGAIADHNLGTIDLFPTLCGLAGVETPKECQGEDFSPAFFGKEGAPDPETQFLIINNFKRNYYHSRLLPGERGIYSPFRAVRGKRYSYAVDALGDWFLYDVLSDPYQLRNLVNDPAYAKVKAKMQDEMEHWLEKAEYPFISDEWKALTVSERITAQNEYYCLLDYQKEWDDYKSAAIAPFLKRAQPDQRTRLNQLADKLFDSDFFGLYLSYDNEINGRRKGTKIPQQVLKDRFEKFETDYGARLQLAAEQILGS